MGRNKSKYNSGESVQSDPAGSRMFDRNDRPISQKSVPNQSIRRIELNKKKNGIRLPSAGISKNGISMNDSRLSIAEIRARNNEAPSRGFVERASEYKVNFKVRYETIIGQSVYVMGSIKELGEWNEFVCPLTWTEGHIWVTNDLIVKSSPIFQYKYVIKQEQAETIWESGMNRIADLTILADQNKNNNGVIKK